MLREGEKKLLIYGLKCLKETQYQVLLFSKIKAFYSQQMNYILHFLPSKALTHKQMERKSKTNEYLCTMKVHSKGRGKYRVAIPLGESKKVR